MHAEYAPVTPQAAVRDLRGTAERGERDARADLVIEAATKRFGTTVALNAAEFRAASGEVHGLLGENGAGKSTLIKILAGAVPPDAARIELFGQEIRFHRPAEAQRAGVRAVFQELSLIPDLTVAENLVFSATRASTRLLRSRSRSRLRRNAVKVFEGLGIGGVDPDGSPATSRSSTANESRLQKQSLPNRAC